ncbi:transmembrane protein 14C [Colletotrichum cereale]|nr:transmembrane protein 14C [Colletotrichum cereale]
MVAELILVPTVGHEANNDTYAQSSDLSVPSFVLGALTATGGIIGYARTRSVPSIVAGISVGLLYGLGGYRIQNSEPYGVELSLLASAVLGGSSIPRALRLRKPVPILLSVLSLFGLYTYGNEFRRTL